METNNPTQIYRMRTDGWRPRLARGIPDLCLPQLPLQDCFKLSGVLLCLVTAMVCPPNTFAGPLDRLSELTDEAALAVVTLKGRDNFNSEYLYDVSVKNLSADPLVGNSLVVVLDKVTNIGGDDRMSGTGQSNLGRMEILGQEGETDDGKPYFRIPGGPALDLPPYSQSLPAAVRIRNKDYLIMFTPKFRVYGLRRMHPPVNFSQDP